MNEKKAQTKVALYNVVMLTKPRFLLSLSKKLDFFTTAKITIMIIIIIKVIVITMLIIIIIMIIK